MKRLALILAALAAAPMVANAAGPAPPRDRKPATRARGARDNIVLDQYRLVVDDDEEGVYLMAPAFNQDTSGQTVRIWVRGEYFETTEDGVRSETTLTEFDCAERRNRALAIDRYKQLNLAEPMDPIDYDLDGPRAARWSYARPGTFGEVLTDKACAIRENIWPVLKGER